MNANHHTVEACKWIFGSISIALATYFTKEPNCLWAFLILAWY